MFGRKYQRKVRYFFARPILPFALEFLILMPLILGLEIPGMLPFYLVASPALILVLGLLNLPLLATALRQFRMDLPVRRNHALEHSTIHFLWKRGRRRTGGSAQVDGFRVYGGATPDEIREAFGQTQALVRDSKPLPYVSRNCGSNRVTALALAMTLLLLLAVVSIALEPPLWARATGLVLIVLLFSSMRHAVGNWVQARLFMSTDFRDARLSKIEKVTWDQVTETPPAYFVKTEVL